MNIPWYYASKGERFGPLSWEEIRQAVDEKDLGPEDLIWSPSFGKEWRKAETLTGLFPPPEPPPGTPAEKKSTNAQTPTAENIERAVEALFQKEAFKSPFAPDTEPAKTADAVQPSINCRNAFLQAWKYTKRLIFITFSFRRWFFLSLCVMLMLMSPPNPLTGFISNNTDSTSAKQINNWGLNEVVESGIFRFKIPLDEETRKEFEGQLSENWSADLGSAMRETAVAISNWFSSGEHRHHLLIAVLGIVLVYAIGIWFSARGNAMFLARIYRPDALIFATWIEADKPAGALFKGMIAIRLISLTTFLLIARHAIVSLAALPPSLAVPEQTVHNIIGNLFFVLIADKLLMGYIRDFVTPHILLTTPKFLTAFKTAFKSTGFWFIRYLLLLSVGYIALFTLFMAIFSLFGMGILLVFAMPLFGALLTLPLHLIRRLWTLHIVFQLHPSLRSSVPRAKLLRIVK